MRRGLLYILFLLLTVAAVHAETAAKALPFEFVDGFILIKAQIGRDGKPATLLLDSGAGASVLDLRAARRLRVPLGAPELVHGVGSESTAFHIGPLSASSDDVVLARIPLAADLSMADQLCRQRIDGLIGVDFFNGKVVQIDYANRVIRFLDEAPKDGDASTLPIRRINGVMCVPVSVSGSDSRWTRLDTGCNDALHWVVLKPRKANRQGRVSLGFLSDRDDRIRTSVDLGKESLHDVEASIHPSALFPGEAGLLGNGLLSRFIVTVDGLQGQVLLQPQKPVSAAAPTE